MGTWMLKGQCLAERHLFMHLEIAGLLHGSGGTDDKERPKSVHMKPASYEVVILILVIVIAVFILRSLSLRLKRRELRFHAAFHSLETDHFLAISKKEACHDTLIGYDECNRKILLLQNTPSGCSSRIFHLTQVRNCSVCFVYYSDYIFSIDNDERLSENDISEIIL